MKTYIILSRFSPQTIAEPKDLKAVARKVSDRIKLECPHLRWKESFATLGRFDVVDIVESDSLQEVEKAAMIIRSVGNSTTETLVASPWHEFLEML
jgi:uncharacterized protein with GYD domain